MEFDLLQTDAESANADNNPSNPIAMEGEIVNRVAKSPLITLDLEAYYPKGPRTGTEISQWLEEGLILREKPFRDALIAENWEPYQGAMVHLYCSTDAIVPAWAYMLITSYLNPYAKKVVVGTASLLETVLFQEALAEIDIEAYRDKPVIIKGCSHLPVPNTAYITALSRIQDVARSIQYGEACSSVPLYKKGKGQM